jgi:hypothetical protein
MTESDRKPKLTIVTKVMMIGDRNGSRYCRFGWLKEKAEGDRRFGKLGFIRAIEMNRDLDPKPFSEAEKERIDGQMVERLENEPKVNLNARQTKQKRVANKRKKVQFDAFGC